MGLYLAYISAMTETKWSRHQQ